MTLVWFNCLSYKGWCFSLAFERLEKVAGRICVNIWKRREKDLCLCKSFFIHAGLGPSISATYTFHSFRKHLPNCVSCIFSPHKCIIGECQLFIAIADAEVIKKALWTIHIHSALLRITESYNPREWKGWDNLCKKQRSLLHSQSALLSHHAHGDLATTRVTTIQELGFDHTEIAATLHGTDFKACATVISISGLEMLNVACTWPYVLSNKIHAYTKSYCHAHSAMQKL